MRQYQRLAQPVVSTPDPVVSIEWYKQQPEPRAPRRVAHSAFAWNTTTPAPPVVPDFGWYKPQPEPRAAARVPHSYFAWNTEIIVVPDYFSVSPAVVPIRLSNPALYAPSFAFNPLPIPNESRLGTMRPIFQTAVLEGSTGLIWAQLQNGEGIFLAPDALASLSLTLYTVTSDGTIVSINGRRDQNVLNSMGVTVLGAPQPRPDGRLYNLRWQLAPADTAMIEERPQESHWARFTWTWANGRKSVEILIVVHNLHTVN